MRKSKVLAKLRNGEAVKIAYLGHFIPPFIAYAAHAGYDGIWLDLEHKAMEYREVQALLAFFHLYDIDCILRPQTREKAQLYRYLEDGATGLMVPHVNDVETVRQIVDAVRFPPIGDRGYEARGLESNFGLESADRLKFIEYANRETFLAVQIETPQAVAELDAIAAVPGIDCLFIGPADLAIRMHFADNPQTYRETLEAVNAAAKKHNLSWGSMPKSAEELKEFADIGADFLLWGIDMRIFRDSLTECSQIIDDIIND
jgi:2-keto-3-deoxy-L-rhamnonate aldolase RhmA